jgi:hypothetical protein
MDIRDNILQTAPLPIRYLEREAIDDSRWDRCVVQSTNSLIYGRSFYLDRMADGRWDALVLGEYEAVMPLTWRRKFGIKYLYQPAFTQQTGIFSRLHLSNTVIQAYLTAAIHRFRFAEIFLNYGNPLPCLQPRTNLILPLEDSYETLAARYRKDLVRNLRLAASSGLQYVIDPDPSLTLQAYRHKYTGRIPGTTPKDYLNFEMLCRHLLDSGALLLRAVSDARHRLLSTAVLPRDEQRIYLLQSTTFPGGREAKANHFLLDQLIKEWAGSRLVLDFEGSDLPGVKLFYEAFGSTGQPYFFYRCNRLPFPLRFLKPR